MALVKMAETRLVRSVEPPKSKSRKGTIGMAVPGKLSKAL
jgi:hypothetical protein